jgi:hypothetical protein
MAAGGLPGRDAVVAELAREMRDAMVAELAREMRDAAGAGRRWIPDYEALVRATGRGRPWCEKAVREARVAAGQTGDARMVPEKVVSLVEPTLRPAATTGAAAGSASAAYALTLTAGQIFSFADLVRRLGVGYYGQDGDSILRQELADALNAFVQLLPEPSGEDGSAYLNAMRAGEFPDWNGDRLPLTESPAEWAARVRRAQDAGDPPAPGPGSGWSH